MQSKHILATGAAICGLTVIIGAFGAHALKPLLEANDRVSPFETGVLYQMFHGLALLIVGIIARENHAKSINRACWFMLIGIVLFSGSLYGLAVWPQLSWLGPVTPIGGVCLILGWVFLLSGVLKK